MQKNKSSKAKIEANRKYNEKNYDRITITVKKGDRRKIKEYCKNNDISVNGYILNKIKEDINIK